jgi:hypothetical protein
MSLLLDGLLLFVSGDVLGEHVELVAAVDLLQPIGHLFQSD